MWRTMYGPLLAAVLLSILAGVGIARGEPGGLRVWADASAIFLLVPLLVFGIVTAVFVYLLAAGVGWLTSWVPAAAHAVNQFIQRIAEYAERFSNSLLKPVFVLKGFSASAKEVVRVIRRLFSH